MKKVIWSIVIIILIGSGFFIQAIYAGDSTRKDAEKSAEDIARETAGMTEVDDFYLYNGNETWSVITGKTADGKKIGVWVPDDKKKKSQIIALSEGISKNKAIAIVKEKKNVKKIVSAHLGMENNQPLWEVTYKNNKDLYGYYYLNFKTGNLIRNYDNL
ncbi:peptidase [Pradoshia sp. D12]|uniref:cell wall elongation regulator TseB-like domain-containing protein n=1 Tax=Bacillaceae TaxID=186817 RepID=UPI00080AF714|nr:MULTISPECIES: DUF5590 domain-containing protein [Bacillaceae]OCA83539.1 hypothetical protein A8L44_11965 [Bacillus sp. FJAT-27986]QFK71779.1 peptidase [Pradoshia sp. D12]TPF73574.1 peptidase [Bacillus sp. D12]